MVSELPIYAGKTLGTSVTRDKVLFVFLAIVLFVTLVVNFTFVTLAVITARLSFAHSVERAALSLARSRLEREPPHR